MEPTSIKVDRRYSSADAIAPEWAEIVSELAQTEIYALTTMLADGTPHTVPVAGAFTGEGFIFCTGESEQKVRNIAINPRISVNVGGHNFSDGRDIVLRGTCMQVTDGESLTALAEELHRKYPDFFHFEITDGALLNAHGNRAIVFQMVPEVVYIFARGEHSAQVTYEF